MYNYCNKCSGKLIKKAPNLYLCQKCDLHFYINPVQTTTAILENEKGEILLVKRKSDPQKGFWDLPGGFTNLNESSEQSLVREIKEELGITLKNFFYFQSYPDRYLYKGNNYYTINLFYIGKLSDKDSKKIAPKDDITEIKFFSKKSLPWQEIAFDCLKKVIAVYFSR